MDEANLASILNLAAALDRLGGDHALLEEVAELFLETSPELTTQIEHAVRTKDARTLERAAHTLKGAISNFAAEDAFQAALLLEKMGRSGDFTAAEDALRNLEIQIARLRPALASLLRRE